VPASKPKVPKRKQGSSSPAPKKRKTGIIKARTTEEHSSSCNNEESEDLEQHSVFGTIQNIEEASSIESEDEEMVEEREEIQLRPRQMKPLHFYSD